MNKDDYYQKLGYKLSQIREKEGLTQKKVALAMGVTFQQYQKYENGSNRIPTKALVTFCELTNCDIRKITGVSLKDYENIYKEKIINNYNTTYVNNYNGFFSNLLNMDLTLMKNKIVVVAVSISIAVWALFAILKAFPILNQEYNAVFLSIQIFFLLAAFAIALFAVFGYSLLTYGITYIVFIDIYSIFIRLYNPVNLPVGISRIIMYLTALALTFITFYILKKLKVNLQQYKNN